MRASIKERVRDREEALQKYRETGRKEKIVKEVNK
jgi:hypothetical protein